MAKHVHTRTTKPRGTKRLAILLRDGLTCTYCQRTAEQVVCLTLDHVVPHSKGGTDDASNLVTACDRCNSSLQDASLAAGIRRLNENHGLGINYRTVAARIRRQTAKDLAPWTAAARMIRKGLAEDPRPAHIGAAKGSPEWKKQRAAIKGSAAK